MKVELNRMKKRIASLLFIAIVFSQLLNAHPAWVQSGVVAYYEGIGAFKNAEGYNSGAMMDVTERVDSASNGNIVVTTIYREPTSGYTITNTSSYGSTDALGAFWYDDRALQGMKTGDKVGIFTITKGPFTDRINGKIWNAVMFEVKDRVEVRAIYDERTGLLLHYAEVYPNQETYIDIKSVSVDLSAYTTPQGVGTPNAGNGLPGYGNNSQNNTGPLGTPLINSNAFCGSLFFIMAGAALAFARMVER